MKRGLIVAALHLAIVLSLTAKYAWDRERLPRAWARTINYDPNLPVRGRYASLMIVVGPQFTYGAHVRLSVRDGSLIATEVPNGGVSVDRRGSLGPIAFYLSEHAKDPTRLEPGEELWAELSVPPDGMPRPLRLGVKKNGAITPLELR